ncbi:MAG TPA: hypothetical protein VE981_16330 [Planctomycetota bacterium]|nr:hypothetical protein [Planctomycetota bacterium]
MNKFINLPDSLAGLVGCVFWIGLLAGTMALLFTALGRIVG